MILLDFLAKYDFAILDTHNRKARINPRIHELLEGIRQAETEDLTNARGSEEISLSNCHMH